MTMQKFKIIIDALLTVFLLLLMPYGLVVEAAYEWIGAGMYLPLSISGVSVWRRELSIWSALIGDLL